MKPRARWCPYGNGYWIVRSVHNGTVYEGVAYSLGGAYFNWYETRYCNDV